MRKKGMSIALQETPYWLIGLAVLLLVSLALLIVFRKDLSAFDVMKQLFRRR